MSDDGAARNEDRIGGSDRLAIITGEPIQDRLIREAVEATASGAVVVFNGVVRDHDSGQQVRSLDYQAHPLAEEMLAACVADVAGVSGLRAAAAHRVGSLQVGDLALCAAVSAPHRAEAFEACARLVEEIKATIPIWKRQHFADGTSEWVGL